jgi:hypothetical protein
MNYTIITDNSKYILEFQEFQEFNRYTKILNIIQYLLIDYRIIEKIIVFLCIIIYPVLGLLNIDITNIILTKNTLILFNISLIFYGCISLYLIK